MEERPQNPQQNPLATVPVVKLLPSFAIPAIISFLVSAFYNIVDQVFIGQGVGQLGNAATAVAFPIATISTALALLIGIGTASNFNLRMGAGKEEEAKRILGTGLTSVVVGGFALTAVVILFLRPLLLIFGATADNLSFALEYTRVVTLGLPFIIFTVASSHLIRSDGSPTYAMVCQLSGAVLNILLDWLFVMVLGWGMAGAAGATVIGQILSAVIAVRYYFHFRSFPLTRELLRPRADCFGAIVSLGMSACLNQLAITLVQITLNNTLSHYGALSVYGRDIPLAAAGIITKVNSIVLGVVIGISQGCQPIIGFNYGAGNYARVKKTYFIGAAAATAVSVGAFLCFQLFPRQIISIFGSGSEIYYRFAERYFHIFMFMTFANGLQPLTGNFFTSIGKAKKGIFVSMTRQILFLIPLVLIFPLFWGIDGVMYAAPIADTAALLLAVALTVHEMRQMDRLAAQS